LQEFCCTEINFKFLKTFFIEKGFQTFQKALGGCSKPWGVAPNPTSL
jgi:hypothetical protein